MRVISEAMSEKLKQSIVIDAKPGGGGIVGFNMGLRSLPDGQTLTAVAQHVNSLPHLHKLPVDYRKEFIFITQLFRYYDVFVVPADSPLNSMGDLLTAARAKPGTVSMGSVQVGGLGWTMIKMLTERTKVSFNEIIYQTTGQQLVDLLGGRLSVGTSLVGDVIQHVAEGKLKVLGVSSLKPVPQLPTAAAVAATVPGFEVSAWFGLAAPPGTPRDRVAAIEDAAVKALKMPELRARLEKSGLEPVGSTIPEFAVFMAKEAAIYQDLFAGAAVKSQ
jgi:tripartite-type tricarboxylate transporter receptor subunit TctC